jgi:hypothetical protein
VGQQRARADEMNLVGASMGVELCVCGARADEMNLVGASMGVELWGSRPGLTR